MVSIRSGAVCVLAAPLHLCRQRWNDMIDMEYYRELISDAMTCRRCDEIAGLLSQLKPENREEMRKLSALQKATARKHDFWKSNPFDLLDQDVDDYIRTKYDLPPPERKHGERKRGERKPLTDEERLKRNAYNREYQRQRRANETPEQRQIRLAQKKAYKEKQKITETSKQRRQRLAKDRERVRRKYHTDPKVKERKRIYARNRYQNDPVARERVKEHSRQYYLKHKDDPGYMEHKRTEARNYYYQRKAASCA